MTLQELLESLKNHGAFFASPSSPGQINLLNINLQKIHAAIVPSPINNLYQTCGGINLGTGYIFGPNEFSSSIKHPVPNLFDINRELTNIANLHGKTMFGRNDLFWFAFDAFGECSMLDNLNLAVLRKYTDPYRAIYECLIGGKI